MLTAMIAAVPNGHYYYILNKSFDSPEYTYIASNTPIAKNHEYDGSYGGVKDVRQNSTAPDYVAMQGQILLYGTWND